MKRRFGIEIELTGLSRDKVVELLEGYFHTKATSFKSSVTCNPYMYHKLEDFNGDRWTVMRDRSIRSEFYGVNRPSCFEGSHGLVDDELIVADSDEFKVELVSPVLTDESIPLLYEIINLIKVSGGLVNDTTGIHIHVDAPSGGNEMLNLLRRFCLIQEDLVSMFSTEGKRLEKYCKLYPPDFVEAVLDTTKDRWFSDVEDVLELYKSYLSVGVSESNPHPEKYYALSLSSLKRFNTVEFRLFNSSLEKDDVAQILNWVLDFCYGERALSLAQ